VLISKREGLSNEQEGTNREQGFESEQECIDIEQGSLHNEQDRLESKHQELDSTLERLFIDRGVSTMSRGEQERERDLYFLLHPLNNFFLFFYLSYNFSPFFEVDSEQDGPGSE